MVFSSIIFMFLYLPLTIIVYYLINKSYRNIFLLVASLFFYFWGAHDHLWIMVLSILINYFFGLIIYAIRNKKVMWKTIVLAMGVTLNLSLLFLFKYLDFSITLINVVFSTSIPLQNIVLPIGISFFTFQGMTYIIDLHRQNVTVQRNPIKVALYISLFPQLIAGPIVRYVDVAEQIDTRETNLNMFYKGILRFIAGLGKKVILANNLASIVDSIFNLPQGSHSILIAWLGLICYALQIYYDFSGYSDMAIGLGYIFGFEFLENFNYPYIATSIREFWQRWHMSLSTFFRDYLYIPLGGNRKGNVYINLLIVFLATGLWHGASMNFILWGLWYGIFIIMERVLSKHNSHQDKNRLSILKHIYTLFVILIGWVLFRSDSLSYTVSFLKSMFSFSYNYLSKVSVMFYLDNFNILIVIIALLLSTPVLCKLSTFSSKQLSGHPIVFEGIRVFSYLLVFVISSIMILNSNYNPFIYFRF